MKKIIMIVAAAALMLGITSAFNEQRFGATPGSEAPMLTLANNHGSVNLADMRGNYVLLSFWSSDDGNSRALCNSYATWFDQNREAKPNFRYVGVNLDANPALYSRIVAADGLNQALQYAVPTVDTANVKQSFGIEQTAGTLLISPDGRVLAVNPTTAQLAAL